MNSGERSGKRGTMMRILSGKILNAAGKIRHWKLAEVGLALSFLLSVCGCGSRAEALIGRADGLSTQPGRGVSEENGQQTGQAGGVCVSEENGQGGEAWMSGNNAQNTLSGQNRASAEPEQLLYVYVCGAVNKPGVVALAPGSRVEDALKAAGGFAGEADKNRVNLADWVTDGEKLYFPTEGEAELPQAAEENAERSDGFVNINSAGTKELCTLPGIGETRAADIISYRERNGIFESTEDIMKVPGIKSAAYEKIKDRITVK